MSAASVKFWENAILKPQKIKLWSFIKKVVSFQWFGYSTQCKCSKAFNFSLFTVGYISLSPPLGAPLYAAVAYGLAKRGKHRILNEIFKKKKSKSKERFMTWIIFVIQFLSHQSSNITACYLMNYLDYVYEVRSNGIIVEK